MYRYLIADEQPKKA